VPPQTSVLIRNLPREVRPDDVREQFSRFGEVLDVYLPKDYFTQQPRGIAFVQFADPRDAADALSLDKSTVGGREVSVQYAEHGRKRPEQMAKRGPAAGGHGHGYGGQAYWGGAAYGGPAYGGGGYGYGGGYDDRGHKDSRRRRHSRSRSRSRSRGRGRGRKSRSPDDSRSRSRERSKRR
jgi:FUS-interacting serine-arginine-rich protein 1